METYKTHWGIQRIRERERETKREKIKGEIEAAQVERGKQRGLILTAG